ncbi:MAG: Gmad2 immunoglobulin-like domain-containing protein [Anaerolineales bacterium]
MNRKLIFPALAFVLALLGCSIPLNTSGTPPLIVTDTPIPLATITETSIPTAIDTLVPTLTTTTIPFNTDTLVPSPTVTITPVLTQSPSPVPSSVPELSVDILRNATYTTPYFLKTVKLVNGAYTEGSGATFYSVQMLDVFAYGDLNGDGKADAAVILAENQGGSGVFESVVAVLNQGGAPHQISSVQLGDRELISSANISLGVIHLDMTVHGPNDPMCCPSQPEVQSFWLLGNNLWLMRLTSGPTGTEREITASYPGNWADVTNPFTVSGDVTISPFENTLNCTVYLLDGSKVNTSSLLVSSIGMGTPGTFTKTFNLNNAGITGVVIVQFKDLSAADGSILALGSVVFNLH